MLAHYLLSLYFVLRQMKLRLTFLTALGKQRTVMAIINGRELICRLERDKVNSGSDLIRVLCVIRLL